MVTFQTLPVVHSLLLTEGLLPARIKMAALDALLLAELDIQQVLVEPHTRLDAVRQLVSKLLSHVACILGIFQGGVARLHMDSGVSAIPVESTSASCCSSYVCLTATGLHN